MEVGLYDKAYGMEKRGQASEPGTIPLLKSYNRSNLFQQHMRSTPGKDTLWQVI